MKPLLLALLVFLSVTVIAQTSTATASKEKVVLVYEKYGYLQGVRLDSLPAKYMYVSVPLGAIQIDYGQQASHREQQVTDREGKRISFDSFMKEGLGALLNFLDYNGWEYVEHLMEPKSSDKYFVFKKKS